MSHRQRAARDKNGQPLHVGDHVTVRAVVKHLPPGLGYYNLTIETVERMGPERAYGEFISLNTRQVEKVRGRKTAT